jgi:hypothetical protein
LQNNLIRVLNHLYTYLSSFFSPSQVDWSGPCALCRRRDKK